MKNFESLNHSHNPNLKENTLKPKYATRTVLFDENGKVAIINVTKHGYYKIPGGGIEDGEDVKAAACREVREEAGCDCTITDTLGNIETPVPVWDMLGISTGFIATVTGEKLHHNTKLGKPSAVSELNGLRILILPSRPSKTTKSPSQVWKICKPVTSLFSSAPSSN